jgi:hypothetical protein
MATKKKMLQAAAGNAGGAGLDITDVFSTYLYEGTGSSQTITNGIDLDGEGGLVWVKRREAAYNHLLFDTDRGTGKFLRSDATSAETTISSSLSSFNSNGFTTGSFDGMNRNTSPYASWTFRKAPKFFDVVTWTGDGSNNRQISHNLDATVGCMIVKRTDTTKNWRVYHRSANATPENGYLTLNSTAAWFDEQANGYNQNQSKWWYTAPTSTDFTVSSDVDVNASGGTYVAYLFAHNDGDGEFGPSGDQDIIKCGSYTGNGSNDGPVIDLGFEPQWLLVKRSSTGANWLVIDNMRGFVAGDNNDALLFPNLSNAEASTNYYIQPTPTGFQPVNSTSAVNANGSTYIYIAIRRGPLAPPESGTEVFAADDETYTTLPQFYSGWPVDFALRRLGKNTTNYTRVIDRLRGNQFLRSDSTNAESALTIDWDVMDGFSVGTSSSADDFSWMWKRAPNFFEVVAYEGNSTSGRTVSHNLGVAPEMMWVKGRSNGASWYVYTEATGNDQSMLLNDNSSAGGGNSWNYTTPSDSSFTLRNTVGVNRTGDTYIAYLFATLPGVSKVGSYTGNGSSQTIDCGFTSGARFILIKRTDGTGDWYIWDSVRGIVSGNDPHISLNNASAEVSDDSIDPDSSGFIVNQDAATSINVSSAEYIFYAIA